MKFLSLGSFLTLSGLAAAGHLHHGGASSYSTVVNHGEGHHVHAGHGYGGGVAYGRGGAAGYGNDGGHDYHSYPRYDFEYGVQDSKTGDVKDQWEHRDGDQVKGSYTLKEADGTTRVVHYHADDHHGFNAVVTKLGTASHPESHQGGWKGGNVDHSYSHGYGHGHASSYAKVKLN
uniref:Cuticle protein n=1 Tax=Musca domestica TaxID=7370 RepID=A0A1I8N580_MUSDO